MRRTLVAALCLCACCLAPAVRATDAPVEEDLTTWVRIRLDEHMSLLGKPLESWIGSVEGDIAAANIRYAVLPAAGNVLLSSQSSSTTGGGLVNGIFVPQVTSNTTTTLQSAGTGAPPPNRTNFWLTGGSAMIGYRFASDTEFFFEMRYLDGTQGDARTSLYTPRLATKMNFSLDEWRLSAATGLRGLFSNTTFGSGQDAILRSSQTDGGSPSITPQSPATTRHQSNINGGGGELGLGFERDFADTGLSAFVRPRAAGIYTQVDRSTTYLFPNPTSTPDVFGQISQAPNHVVSSSSGVLFLETGMSIGATWRPTFMPRVQLRLAYDYEHYFTLNRNLFGQSAFLTGHNFIGGLDYSF